MLLLKIKYYFNIFLKKYNFKTETPINTIYLKTRMEARQLFFVADMGKSYWITNFTIRGPLKEIRKQLHDWWRCFFISEVPN